MQFLRALTTLSIILVAPSLFAAEAPRVGDLREEQRKIQNAHLGDATFQLRQARERIGSGNARLGQQSGLWALEQLAFAKRRLERHAARIEEARGFFGRASERTRADLRESYRHIRQHYVDIEEQIDGLAIRLNELGHPILAGALGRVRASVGGDEAVRAVQDAMREAGVSGRGEEGNLAPEPQASYGSPSTASEIMLGDGTQVTVDANGDVYLSGRKVAGLRYDPTAGQFILPNGKIVNASDLRVGPGGVIQGVATDGSRVELNPETGQLREAGSGAVARSGFRGGSRDGFPPAGARLVGADGQPITVDGDAPPFQNGTREFIRKTYLGAPNTLLQRETKVTQELLEAGDEVWRVQETLGESRNWSLSISLDDVESQPGRLSANLAVVDASGNSGLKVADVTVANDAGRRATVQPDSSSGYRVTFTEDGDYTAVAEGQTDWGSVFRIEAVFPIAVR